MAWYGYLFGRPAGRLCALLFGVLFPGAQTLAQRPELVVPSGHNAWVTAFEISPDGRYLLTAAMDRSIKIWDLEERREVFTFWKHADYANALDISPDNRTVASADVDGNLIWWDFHTGAVLKENNGVHQCCMRSVSFSGDGDRLLTADYNGVITYWSVPEKDSLYQYLFHDFPVVKAAFSPDDNYFLSVAPDTSRVDSSMNMGYWEAEKDADLVLTHYYSSALLKNAAISPDQQYFAAVTDQPAQLRLIHAGADSVVLKFPLESITPQDVLFLDTNRILIAGIHEEKARFLVYDRSRGAVTKTFERDPFPADLFIRPYPGDPGKIAFSGSTDIAVYSLDLETGVQERLNPQYTNTLYEPIILGDSLFLAGNAGNLLRWNLKGADIATIHRGKGTIRSLAGRGERIFFTKEKEWGVWNTLTGKVEHEAQETVRINFDITLSPDGKLLLVPLEDGETRIYRTGDFGLHTSFRTGYANAYYDPVVWLNDQVVAYNNSSERNQLLLIYDTGKQELLRKIDTKQMIRAISGSIPGEVLIMHIGGMLSRYDYRTGELLGQKRIRENGGVYHLAYEKGLNRIVLGVDDGTIYFMDPESLEITGTLSGHTSWINGVAFSGDYQRAYSTSYDNTIRIWDLASGRCISSLAVLEDREWVSLDGTGLFDASPQAMKLMYFVVNAPADEEQPWKIIELNQLKHRYYQPDLLQIGLGYSDQEPRLAPGLDHIDLPPKVSGSIEGNLLSIDLLDQQGGIGKVSVLIDGAEVIADARAEAEAGAHSGETNAGKPGSGKIDPGGKTPDKKGSSALNIRLNLERFSGRFDPGRASTIRIIAWNGDNWLSSKPLAIQFSPPGAKGISVRKSAGEEEKDPAEQPRLFALVFGTSDYAGTEIDLKYASKDAVDFAAALERSASNLFGVPGVRVELFHSEAEDPMKQPSKENFTACLRAFEKEIRPSDIFVVYLSGHGVNFGGADGDFYYLTSTASGADATYLNDPAVREGNTISSNEMTALLNRITARKKILVLDACASGKAAETMLAAARDVPASQVRALDRMNDRTGFYILSGSAADAVSYESSVYGQGLLTYALLKAMRGAALRIDGGEEYVDVQQLLQYAVNEVPLLAKGIGGIQKPLYRSPDDMQSFDIGRMDETAKAAIVISEPKPVFVAASFQDAMQLFDDLGLSEKINAQLREHTARGKTAGLIFTEAKDYPGAYRVSGNYERNGTALTLKYVITRDRERIGEVREFRADFSDTDTFVRQFLEQLISGL